MTALTPPPSYLLRVCPTCGKVRAPSDAREMYRMLERQRYTLDNDELTLHLWEAEDDHTVSMACGAHCAHQGVYLSPMQAPPPVAHRRPTGEQTAEEISYREALLAALDRNTRAICDALADLAWRVGGGWGSDR